MMKLIYATLLVGKVMKQNKLNPMLTKASENGHAEVVKLLKNYIC